MVIGLLQLTVLKSCNEVKDSRTFSKMRPTSHIINIKAYFVTQHIKFEYFLE